MPWQHPSLGSICRARHISLVQAVRPVCLPLQSAPPPPTYASVQPIAQPPMSYMTVSPMVTTPVAYSTPTAPVYATAPTSTPPAVKVGLLHKHIKFCSCLSSLCYTTITFRCWYCQVSMRLCFWATSAVYPLLSPPDAAQVVSSVGPQQLYPQLHWGLAHCC